MKIMESSAFELACVLHQRGWVCSVKPAGQRKRSSKSKVGPGHAPNVVDYTPGEDKRWWIKHDQTNFKPIYMRALLMADTMIRKPIPHLKAENYYESLLKGETPVPKNRKSTFDIDGTVKPRRKQRKRAEASKASMTKSRLESSDPDDASRGKSSSSSTSSTSSSSSSESESVPIVPAVVPEKAIVPEAAVVPEKAIVPEARPEPVVVVTSRPVLDTTLLWKTFRFTEVKSEGIASGYEVNCYICDHNRCTRTMRFAKHGGRERTEHMLKCWAVSGFAKRVKTNCDHAALPWLPDPLPPLEELEGFEVPPDRVRLKRQRA